MFTKIKKILKSDTVKQLQDVRVLGLLVFALLVLLVSWTGVKVIQTNYELERSISKLRQENQVRELENANLKLRNQYYNTDQFLELAARRQFGLGAPGEKLILIPKAVALAHTVELPNSSQPPNAQVEEKKSKQQSNLEAWINFFLHRQQSE